MPEATLAALLLPPNRSALESAVVQALHTRTHPERTIATLHQPGAAGGIAAPLLPWLAWGARRRAASVVTGCTPAPGKHPASMAPTRCPVSRCG